MREDRDDAFAGHGKTKPGDDAVAQLRRELARVKGELDIFETAIPFFAQGYR
jgi:hypothetical protein